jgi:hypothetical protein
MECQTEHWKRGATDKEVWRAYIQKAKARYRTVAPKEEEEEEEEEKRKKKDLYMADTLTHPYFTLAQQTRPPTFSLLLLQKQTCKL